MDDEKKVAKRLLIYLDWKFEGDFGKVMKELVEKKLEVSDKEIKGWFVERGESEDDYITLLEDPFLNKICEKRVS